MPTLKILFVADPLEHFDPVAETTLYLMKEAARRRYPIYHCLPQDISARGLEVWVQTRRVRIRSGGRPWFAAESPQPLKANGFSAIVLRKDPPFDQNYLHHLYLLRLVSDEVYLMNHPEGILSGNEKILALPFGNRTPPTLISASEKEIRRFIGRQAHGTIVKPINFAGGKGIFRVPSLKSENCNIILETATQGFTHHVVVQAYLPEARQGDKRIMLLGQDVLGAFIRVPAPGEHRANLHAGGRAKKARLTKRDRELVAAVTPTLQVMGLDFVGLDVIGDKLIEVNVTSPMGLHELNLTAGGRSESKVLDFLERMAG